LQTPEPLITLLSELYRSWPEANIQTGLWMEFYVMASVVIVT